MQFDSPKAPRGQVYFGVLLVFWQRFYGWSILNLIQVAKEISNAMQEVPMEALFDREDQVFQTGVVTKKQIEESQVSFRKVPQDTTSRWCTCIIWCTIQFIISILDRFFCHFGSPKFGCGRVTMLHCWWAKVRIPFLAFQSAGNDYRDLDGGNLTVWPHFFRVFRQTKAEKKQKNCRVHEEYHC